MNLLSNVKKPLAFTILALALIISSVILPSGSSARSTQDYPNYFTYSTYYSDGSLSQEVGTLYVECSGRTHKTGVITQYRTEEIIDVCIDGLPQ